MRARNLAAIGALLGLAGCGAAPAITGCEPGEGLTPVCTFTNPEDMALLPGSDWLAVSEMSRGDAPGVLSAWRPSDGTKLRLWEGATAPGAPDWGAPDCPGAPDPAAFRPHGIDVIERGEGSGLLVVNHGGREAVEFFELAMSGGRPQLLWRGCAPAPPHTTANDVAALPGGEGFVVSKMTSEPMSGGLSLGLMLKILMGRPTGLVYEWTETGGWRAIPGSEGVLPNGVEVSSDGARVFVGMSGGRSVVALDRADGAHRRVADVGLVSDNLTWSDDGRILVAGGTGSRTAALGCRKIDSGACGVPFAVAAVDPQSMAVETLLKGDGRVGIGMASVALQVGQRLYIGSFAADRIAWAPFPAH